MRTTLALLDDFEWGASSSVPEENKGSNAAIEKRSGTDSGAIVVEELRYVLTAHDLKRLELYGRNLCDHHLIKDLVSSLAQLYFRGRFGTNFRLFSIQGVLLYGIGL